jgi:hypothetical protein
MTALISSQVASLSLSCSKSYLLSSQATPPCYSLSPTSLFLSELQSEPLCLGGLQSQKSLTALILMARCWGE